MELFYQWAIAISLTAFVFAGLGQQKKQNQNDKSAPAPAMQIILFGTILGWTVYTTFKPDWFVAVPHYFGMYYISWIVYQCWLYRSKYKMGERYLIGTCFLAVLCYLGICIFSYITEENFVAMWGNICLLYTSPSPRD